MENILYHMDKDLDPGSKNLNLLKAFNICTKYLFSFTHWPIIFTGRTAI